MLLSVFGNNAQTLPFRLSKGAGTFRLGVVCGNESCWLDQCSVKKKGQAGEEVCTRLHLSPRTLQTLRDRRQIPFTVLGNRLLLYPESGIRAVLDRNLRPAAK